MINSIDDIAPAPSDPAEPALTAADRITATVTERDIGTRRAHYRTFVSLTWDGHEAEIEINEDGEAARIEIHAIRFTASGRKYTTIAAGLTPAIWRALADLAERAIHEGEVTCWTVDGDAVELVETRAVA